MFNMHKGTHFISQKEIINMYERGFSCKDICLAMNMPAIKVRAVLRDAGFNTGSYRKVSEYNKEKVILLIKAGYSYKKIENLLHLSTHLIREIVEQAELVGFASNYHPPIELNVKEKNVRLSQLSELKSLYIAGNYGLAKCADMLKVTDDEFLWFVFHLTDRDMKKHCNRLKSNVFKMFDCQIPITAIAKSMDISPSIIKKILKKRVV